MRRSFQGIPTRPRPFSRRMRLIVARTGRRKIMIVEICATAPTNSGARIDMRWVCSMLPPGEFHTVPVVSIGILEGGGEGVFDSLIAAACSTLHGLAFLRK